MKEEFLKLNSEEVFEKVEQVILSYSPSNMYLESGVYGKLNIESEVSLYETLVKILEKRQIYRSINPETKQVYEPPYDHSTITDIFRIVRYYRPDTKLIDVYCELFNGLNKKEIRSWICNGIGCRTYDVGRPGGFISQRLDEYRIKLPEVRRLYNSYGDRNIIKNFKI